MFGRKIISRIGLLFLILGIPGLCSAAATGGGFIHIVPDTYATIQNAIDAAGAGDVVLVKDGTYRGTGNVNLDLKGKAITIRSMNGPMSTFIDCEGTSRGFIFQTSETPGTIVSGLTIMNGYAEDGGGAIMCRSASPTINDCVLMQNKAKIGGGAIFCDKSSPIVFNCNINDNSTPDGKGGAIFSDSYSSPYIIGSYIQRNTAPNGGGISCSWTAPIIRGCTITHNEATTAGGGIFSDYGSPQIINSTISWNSVSSSGGRGGGIAGINSSNPTLINCVITNNAADEGGAILFSGEYSFPTITNCTFNGNSAAEASGAIHLQGMAVTPRITNSILWDDSPSELVHDATSNPIVKYSDIQGEDYGETNIDLDPVFFDPTIDDYHLRPDSPCIDQNDDNSTNPESTDRDGSPRMVGDATDMGAYELQTVSLDATVSILNRAGEPLSENMAYIGQDILMSARFNSLNELDVPFEQLLGRTLTLTFNPPGTAGSKPVFLSLKIESKWKYLVGMGSVYRIPNDVSPGAYVLTGKIEISGLECYNNENSTDYSVEGNPAVSFTFPFSLPAASTTNPAVNAYRMIGVPVVPSPDPDVFGTFKSFFGGAYDPTMWRMYAYASSAYNEISDFNQDQIDYGKGWWIISSFEQPLTITGAPQRWDDGYYLFPGYQMIACPFWDTSISWQDILEHNPDLGSNSILYEWDGSGNYVSAASMSPGKAYLIWAPAFTVLNLKRDYTSYAFARHLMSNEPSSRIIPLPAPAPPGAFTRVLDPNGARHPMSTLAAPKVTRQPPPPLPPGAYIQVLSPKGGEKLKGGKPYTIRWESLGISPQKAGGTVKIAYSTNGGKTYRRIASRVKNTGSYTWMVPNIPSKRCKIRVTSSLYPSVRNASEHVFTIK